MPDSDFNFWMTGSTPSLLNKHPSEFFFRWLIIRDPNIDDAHLMKATDDWGMLQPPPTYWGFLRQKVLYSFPTNFSPLDKANRESMKYLREQEVYELFHSSSAVEEAWAILSEPFKRMTIEQALMARLDHKMVATKLNKRYDWHITADGVRMFGHLFWNVKLLTFDEWGRFLYGRSAMYERHLSLLQATPQLAFFHLRLEQTLESKKMIQRVQEIAFHTIEEVAQRAGSGTDKVKAIGILGKTVIDAHTALSTSDMALKDVLKQFERFRMEHPQTSPPDIRKLAPGGNFTGSGIEEEEKDGVH